MKERTLNVGEIITLLERCGIQDFCDDNVDCPLKGECLYWWTGDDSELED